MNGGACELIDSNTYSTVVSSILGLQTLGAGSPLMRGRGTHERSFRLLGLGLVIWCRLTDCDVGRQSTQVLTYIGAELVTQHIPSVEISTMLDKLRSSRFSKPERQYCKKKNPSYLKRGAALLHLQIPETILVKYFRTSSLSGLQQDVCWG